MKAAEFVGKLFLARDVAHSVHLNTRSYAKHKTLKTFYEDIVDMADEFAEAYMGKKGLIGQIPLLTIKKQVILLSFSKIRLRKLKKKGILYVTKRIHQYRTLLIPSSHCIFQRCTSSNF